MESNQGPTLVAFALNLIESQFLFRPRFYKRYVDAVFAKLDSDAKMTNRYSILDIWYSLLWNLTTKILQIL